MTGSHSVVAATGERAAATALRGAVPALPPFPGLPFRGPVWAARGAS